MSACVARRLTLLTAALTLAGAACTGRTPAPAAAPTPTVGADLQAAQQALLTFLEDLSQGRFDQALPTYAGPYDSLQVFDPSIPPEDHLALLRNACVSRNLQCLAPRGASLKETPSSTEYVFLVEFNNGDGTLFVRGPCCGASETEMPPESAFAFRVVKANDGRYSVLDLPPYVP